MPDMLRKPRFDQAEIDRVKGQWIAGIKQEKANPNGIIQRVSPAWCSGRASVRRAAHRQRHRGLDRRAHPR